MNSKHKWIKVLLMFPLLLVITLLFLEMPQIYYRYSDQELLKESDCSKYESHDAKHAKTFFEKAEKFLFYNDTLEQVHLEHEVGLMDEELYDTGLKLVQELNLLLGGNYKDLLEELLVGYKDVGSSTRLYRYSDSYLEVGFFEFIIPDTGTNGTILYDIESYKILWIECWYVPEVEGVPEAGNEKFVLEYYKDMVSNVSTFMEDPGYILITPFQADIVREKFFSQQEPVSEIS